MSEVGKVEYKAKVDTSSIDSDIKDTESKLKKMGDEADDAFDDVEKGADDAAKSTEKLGNSVEKSHSKLKTFGSIGISAVKGIGTAFVGLASAAGTGIAAIAKMGVEYNAQMESYQTSFETMLGDAEKAQALTDNLKTLAAKTPLAMTDLADASKILLAFGSSAEALPDQLKRLGDVSLGNAEALGTMATAFGRVQSNGYASLEEINMMIDQGFNPLQIIAEQTGETMAEVRDRVSDGGVSFEELNNALVIATESGGQFYNAMEEQSKTFEGQMSTLKDNIAGLTGAITEELFAGLAETTLPMVNDWVDQLMTATQEGGIEGAIEVAGGILTEMLTALLNGAPRFIETATSLVSSFLQSIRDNGPQITEGAINVITTLITGFVNMVPDIISTAGTLIAGLVNGIANNLPQILQSGIKLIVSLISGIGQATPQIISAIGNLVVALGRAILQTDWIGVGKDIIRGLINGIGAMGSALWDAARSIASKALSAIKGFFGIRSPSRVMKKEVGEQLNAGIAEGMKDYSKIDKSALGVSKRVTSQLTYDMNYNLPNTQDLLGGLSAGITGTFSGAQTITVPLYIDGREVARATAWRMGEQLSWEEM